MSLKRAEKLYHTMLGFASAYGERFSEEASPPFPRPLTVIKLGEYPVEIMGQSRSVPIEILLSSEGLLAAPLEYRQLAQLVAIIPAVETLEQVRPAGSSEWRAFTQQLFQLIGFCHGPLNGTFSRGTGSCVEPELLTPSGALNDLYFLTGSDEVPSSVLAQGRRRDLVHGFVLLLEADGADEGFPETLLEAALSIYQEAAGLEGRMDEWVGEARQSWRACVSGTSNKRQTWNRLANAMLAE